MVRCHTTTKAPAGWWQRVAQACLTVLVILGPLVLPPARPARAEVGFGDPIKVGSGPGAAPSGVAVNPIANRIYVTNEFQHSVSVIDGATSSVVGPPIPVGRFPTGIAFNPTNSRVYVANLESKSVSVIDAATNTVIDPPINVGVLPDGVAVNPATNRIYVANAGSKTVSVIDGTSSTVVSVPVPEQPHFVAVNPVTNRVYVTNRDAASVTVIDAATNTVVAQRIEVGSGPRGIAVNAITNRIYVAIYDESRVVVIDGATNMVVGQPIPTELRPFGVAINPATSRVYVTNSGATTMTTIDASTDPARVATTPLGRPSPLGVAVNPVTGRVYAVVDHSSVMVAGIGLAVASGLSQPAGTVSVSWTAQFPSNGADFVGLYDPKAPNSSPLSRVYTNGTTSPGGPGLGFGTVNLPIPAGLPVAEREARFVSGAGGGTFGVVGVAMPVANADGYSATAAKALNVAAPGVLTNDAVPSGARLQVGVVANPTNGTLALQPNGGFSYTPRAGFTGTDKFTYRATSPAGLAATSTATIVVSAFACDPRPAVKLQTAVVGGALQVTATASGADGATPNRLRELRFDAPVNGRVELAGQSHTAAFTYAVPSSGDRVTFTVRRVTAGQPTMVPLTVTDACGPWRTLVGGGTAAGF